MSSQLKNELYCIRIVKFSDKEMSMNSIKFDEKNCSQKNSVQGSLQLMINCHGKKTRRQTVYLPSHDFIFFDTMLVIKQLSGATT